MDKTTKEFIDLAIFYMPRQGQDKAREYMENAIGSRKYTRIPAKELAAILERAVEIALEVKDQS